jgi:hypothetical protein
VTTVELRCDQNPSKLLAKVKAPRIVDGNLIEIACTDCAKRRLATNGQRCQVLHRFNVLGELVESEIVARNP